MARNYHNVFYMDTQEHAIHHVWIHLIPTSLYDGRMVGFREKSSEKNPSEKPPITPYT